MEVRNDARKGMEGSSGQGGDGGDRNKQKTVVGAANSGDKIRQPWGVIGVGSWGKWRRMLWAFYRT